MATKPKPKPKPKRAEFRHVAHISPTVFGVFPIPVRGPPEAIFSDEVDAEIWAAMRDELDNPTDEFARERLSDAANGLLASQTAPVAKVRLSS